MKDLTIMMDGDVKLNVRTTGIFINGEKVLVHKCDEGHYALPGGRVQANEDSISALKREVAEELNLEIENTYSIGVVENFFTVPEANYHEYMWMIKSEFKDKSVYDKENIIGCEQNKQLVFEWVDINKLEDINFRPIGVIPYLKNIDEKVHHIIIK